MPHSKAMGRFLNAGSSDGGTSWEKATSCSVLVVSRIVQCLDPMLGTATSVDSSIH